MRSKRNRPREKSPGTFSTHENLRFSQLRRTRHVIPDGLQVVRPRPATPAETAIRLRSTASRRGLLAGLAGGALMSGLAALAGGASAERWRPRFILASALYGGSPLEAILPEVARAGCDTIDLWPRPHGTQREEVDRLGPERVRKRFEAAGVGLGSIACYKPGPFALAGEFDVATRLGGEGVILVTGCPGDADLAGDPLDRALRDFLERLGPGIEAARQAGGFIAIENHAKSLLKSPESIRRLAALAKSDRVGIALAPHHLPQDPALLAELAHDLGPKLLFVYAQQHGRGAWEKVPKEEELLQMPGRGPLDFGPLLRQLAAMRYAGPIEIFMHPTPRGVPILDSVEAVTAEVNRSRTHLESLVQAAEQQPAARQG
jgi:sugar phosphate isomerase/epimerase